jgi:exodeoxyribonuclease III
MAKESLTILTLNVCSPSVSRAEHQLEWLEERPEEVFVLTETSGGKGSEILADRLRSAGWAVAGGTPLGRERGVLIASRVALSAGETSVVYLPERVMAVAIGRLEIIGVYTPSRDESAEKVARKRRFLAELLTVVGAGKVQDRVLIGDLNIVERGQHSAGGVFRDWEYELYDELPALGWLDAYRVLHPERVELSWVDGDGRGYRFDHTFITADLREQMLRCEYVHETREADLSDHSAMVIELTGVKFETLDIDQSLGAGPPSLF